MNPNASDITLVNSLIEIAAKGTALQMQMKDFTHNSILCTSVLQPNPCLTNTTVSQVNLTSTADNTDKSDHKSVSRSHVSEKYDLVSLSQLNTVNNTDTVIDLNLNTNHLIDQPFSMDQQGIVSAIGTFYYGVMEEKLVHLYNFFDQYILPKLAYPRLKFGLWYDLKLK